MTFIIDLQWKFIKIHNKISFILICDALLRALTFALYFKQNLSCQLVCHSIEQFVRFVLQSCWRGASSPARWFAAFRENPVYLWWLIRVPARQQTGHKSSRLAQSSAVLARLSTIIGANVSRLPKNNKHEFVSRVSIFCWTCFHFSERFKTLSWTGAFRNSILWTKQWNQIVIANDNLRNDAQFDFTSNDLMLSSNDKCQYIPISIAKYSFELILNGNF